MVSLIGTLTLALLLSDIIALASVSNSNAAVAASTQVRSELKSDLREFAALIPRRRVGFIAARHFVLDADFRRALFFIRSAQFMETWQQIRNTTEFQNILTHVTSSGRVYDVTSVIDSVPNRLRAFRIASKVPVEMMLSRTFTSFLREVIDALPREKVANLMVRKVEKDGEFSRFYKALKSKEFRELVQTARNSSTLSVPFGVLEQNSIRVDEILEMGFEMLNWGPQSSFIQ